MTRSAVALVVLLFATSLPAVSADAPPSSGWLVSPSVPGFEVHVSFETPAGSLVGSLEPACIPETACVSGALAGRPEVFFRMVGPKPNGFLWPTLVKFSTSEVEAWVRQTATGEVRRYELAGARPGFDELPGLFDPRGFRPIRRSAAVVPRALAAAAEAPRGAVFEPPILEGTTDHVRGLEIADVTGDGIDDVVAVTGFCPGQFDCRLLVFPGNRTGTLGDPVAYPLSVGLGLLVDDLNDDGRNDVLVGEYGVAPRFFRQRPDGTLEDTPPPAALRLAFHLTSGDLNGDGLTDVVSLPVPDVGPAPLVVDLNYQNPDGSFTRKSLDLFPSSDISYGQVELADLDGDGLLDLFIADRTRWRIDVVFQGPRGSFTERWIYDGVEEDVQFGTAFIGAFDADALPDIVLPAYRNVFHGRPEPILLRLDPSKARTWTISSSEPVSGGPAGLATDLDGDGRDDLVTVDFAPLDQREAKIFLQGSDGGFEPSQRFDLPWSNYDHDSTMAAGDLDDDGRTDIAIASDNAGIVLLLQEGAGEDAPPPELFSPDLPDYGVTVRITPQGGTATVGGLDAACIAETMCVSGALPGRSEVFVRVVGPKPNGFLWPTLVKFTTSRVDIWIHRLSTGEVRHYHLPGSLPNQGLLPGLFDRRGFAP